MKNVVVYYVLVGSRHAFEVLISM